MVFRYGIVSCALTLLLVVSPGLAVDFTWDVDGDGNWSVDGNWDETGFPNDPADNATITNTASSTAVVVTVGPTATRDVNNLIIADNGANPDHELFIANNTSLDIHGTVTNDGLISINSAGSITKIQIEGNTSFNGDGSIVMGNSFANQITGTGAFLLTNSASHTIRGGGNLGVSTLGVINNGVIDADTGGTTMLINPGGLGISNTNIMRATNGGTLSIISGNTSGGGTILADGAGSLVTIGGATIIGNTLNTTNGGEVRIPGTSSATFNGVTNQGILNILNNSTIDITGTITNNGTITAVAAGNPTGLEVQALGATLTGPGSFVMSGNPSARITALSDATLINDTNHTIEGLGDLGLNTMSLDNRGTVDANAAGSTLVLDPVTAGSFDNTGTMRATNGGFLRFDAGTYNNAGGVILADGAGSQVQFNSSAVINNGILRTTNGGLLRQLASTNAFFTDLTIDTGSAVQIDNNSDFGISGTITNNGTITAVAAGNPTGLEVQALGATLTGPGSFVMSGNPSARITALSDATLINDTNHTIEGLGDLGLNTMSLDNRGTVDANAAGSTLVLDPVTAGSFDNTGTMRATNGGFLRFDAGTYNNAGGVILADGAGSQVQFNSSAVINDGILRTTNGGLLRQLASTNAFFTDQTIDTGSAVQIDNNSDFGISGTITNHGTITAISIGNETGLEVQDGGATLAGSGTVVLSNHPNAAIDAINDSTLTNTASHTIQGQGQIGQNSMSLINQGTVDANVTSKALFLDPATVGSFDNTGTMKATNGGILQLGTGIFNNVGGVIEADGTVPAPAAAGGGSGVAVIASEVQLFSTAEINGGTLRSVNGGLVRQVASSNVFLTDVTIEGNVQIDNNSDFGITGTITNNGTITAISLGNETGLEVQAAGATFAGSGRVVLSNHPAAAIDAINDATLTNTASHTIEGQGQIGQNSMSLINQGTVDANVSGQGLVLDPDNSGSFDNTGTFQATGGGILQVQGGIFNNTGGLILADGAGSEVRLGSLATIIGGTIRTTNGGLFHQLGSLNGRVDSVTIDGDVLIENNSDFEVKGVITNNGTITVNSLGNATGLEVQADGTTLTGNGTVVLSNSSASRIDGASGETLINDTNHTIEGGGSIGTNAIGIDNRGLIHANSAITLQIDPETGQAHDNTGELRASGAGGLSLHGGPHNNKAGGLVDVQSILGITTSGVFTNELGGLVKGDGTIDNDGTFINDGSVTPGDSPGILTFIGDFVQGSTGTLEIEINGVTTAGTDYDQFPVDGDVDLAGTLDLQLGGGYTPTLGDEADIMPTTGTVTGVFEAITNVVQAGNLGLAVRLNATDKIDMRVSIRGDTDFDNDVDTADLTTAIIGFTGAVGNTSSWESGDYDGDADTDTADLTTGIINFTGASAANPNVPDLVYDPATGNVTIDADGADVISFSLQAGPFNAADFSELPAGLTDNIASQIGWTSFNLFSGLTGTANLGAILPAGLDQAGLEAALTTASYGLALAGGGGGGRLDIIIPEPASMVLMGLGAMALVRRRRAA